MKPINPCNMTGIEVIFVILPVILLFLFGLAVIAIFTGGIKHHIQRIIGAAHDDLEMFICFTLIYVTLIIGIPLCLLAGISKCG